MNKELNRRREMEVVVAKSEVLFKLLPEYIRAKQEISLISQPVHKAFYDSRTCRMYSCITTDSTMILGFSLLCDAVRNLSI